MDERTVDSWGAVTHATTGTLALQPTSDGQFCCPKHPSQVFPSTNHLCDLCEREFQERRRQLQEKRASVNEQLQAMASDDGSLRDLQQSLQEWKPAQDDPESPLSPQKKEDKTSSSAPHHHHKEHAHHNNHSHPPISTSTPPPQWTLPPRPPRSPPSYMHPAPNQPQPSGPPMYPNPASNQPIPPPFSYGFSAPSTSSFDALAMQIQRMQHMQDWMLMQKEHECAALKVKLDEATHHIQELRVENALLTEKLAQQEQRMQHELKLIKLAAYQQRKGSNNNYNQEQRMVVVTPNPHELVVENSGEVGKELDTEKSPPRRHNQHTSQQQSPPRDSLEQGNPPELEENSPVNNKMSAITMSNQDDQITTDHPTVEHPPLKMSRPAVEPATAGAAQATLPTPPLPPKTPAPSPVSMIHTAHVPEFLTPTLSRLKEAVMETSEPTSPPSPPITTYIAHSREDDGFSHDIPREFTVTVGGPAEVPLEEAITGTMTAFSSTGGPVAALNQQVRSPPRADPASFNTSLISVEDPVAPSTPTPATAHREIDVKQREPPQSPYNSNTDSVCDDEVMETWSYNGQEEKKNNSSGTTTAGTTATSNAAAKTTITSIPPLPVSKRKGISFVDDSATEDQTVASSTFGEDRVKVSNQSILDPYGDKGHYTGIILRSTGMPHGYGKMIYVEDNRTYDGHWRHGRWHGYGHATFANGDSYLGEYRFDQRHGQGRYEWNDGRVYDGMFREDKRHGKGRFEWPDGAEYIGEFSDGQRSGQGCYKFADGGRYDGSWVNGRYSGFGICTWEDGRTYKGEWRDGRAHGRGVETFADGTIRHDGLWVEDEPVL